MIEMDDANTKQLLLELWRNGVTWNSNYECPTPLVTDNDEPIPRRGRRSASQEELQHRGEDVRLAMVTELDLAGLKRQDRCAVKYNRHGLPYVTGK